MQRDLAPLFTQQFDLLVCGGGIYGAWTAYDAALRGLKVAIVEQGDWASGTSSASSKLIHGGLRYLQSLDFKLVHKSLKERELLKKIAPHRVWSLGFGVPVYLPQHRMRALQLSIGLKLYDALALTGNTSAQSCRYSATEFSQRFPAIKSTGLTAGFIYSDAQTDDARLVLELVDGAMILGAVCVNYCQVTGFLEQSAAVVGASIQDVTSGETGKVYAKQIVDSMGRWSSIAKAEGCRLSKGVHLILPKILDQQALLITAKTDKRVIFIIPWYGRTLLGTTDTNYQGDITKLRVEKQEISYLLNEVNQVLATANWTQHDVIGSFAGLRVLQASRRNYPGAISRDWHVHRANNGLWSSIGGKITSAREDAAVMVDAICQALSYKQICQTLTKPLPWVPEGEFSVWWQQSIISALALGIDEESAGHLLHRHGWRIEKVLCLCTEHPDWVNRIDMDVPFIMADLVFCAQNEMVVHLDDVLRRRLPLLILTKLNKEQWLALANTVGNVLGWDETRTQNELNYCVQNLVA